MIPNGVWPGAVIALGSRLVGVAPVWWVAVKVEGVTRPVGLYWEIELDQRTGLARPYRSPADATAAAALYRGQEGIVAAAVLGCDRPPPPVPSGEDSAGCDCAVIRVWVFRGEADELMLGIAPGKAQLSEVVMDLYQPVGAGAGKGGRRGA